MTEEILYKNLTDRELLIIIDERLTRINEMLDEICQGIKENKR